MYINTSNELNNDDEFEFNNDSKQLVEEGFLIGNILNEDDEDLNQ